MVAGGVAAHGLRQSLQQLRRSLQQLSLQQLRRSLNTPTSPHNYLMRLLCGRLPQGIQNGTPEAKAIAFPAAKSMISESTPSRRVRRPTSGGPTGTLATGKVGANGTGTSCTNTVRIGSIGVAAMMRRSPTSSKRQSALRTPRAREGGTSHRATRLYGQTTSVVLHGRLRLLASS